MRRTLAALILVASHFAGRGAAADCLPSGTEEQINRALLIGGSRSIIELCPRSVHRLQSPIMFTSAEQVLTTQGQPKDQTRALLVVEGELQSVAIRADCPSCNSARISHLLINGNRPLLLRIPKGEALVELGNAEHQVVEHCRIWEPRGWSALHFREGDRKGCKSGVVRNNIIGPAGEEWDVDYDGLEEGDPNWGNPRADGISIACKDTLVEKNTVFDTTDGAIVIFGSAGTEVRHNEIFSRTRVVMGGINLVDYDPWDGDFTRVKVHHNVISAYGSYIKSAINVGPSTWTDDTESLVHSGSVTDNEIHGDSIGYGIVVASAKGFTVMRNKSTAKYSGKKGFTCPTNPDNAAAMAFLINRGSSEGTYQEEFVNGEVQHIICIEPEQIDGLPYKPFRFRDCPEAVNERMADIVRSSQGNVAMPDVVVLDHVVSYQAKIMEAMTFVTKKVMAYTAEMGDKPKKPMRRHGKVENKSPLAAALEDLGGRLEVLESERQEVRSTFETLSSDLKRQIKRFTTHERSQQTVLRSVQDAARTALGSRSPTSPGEVAHTTNSIRSRSKPKADSKSNWTPAIIFAFFQLVILISIYAWKASQIKVEAKRRISSTGTIGISSTVRASPRMGTTMHISRPSRGWPEQE